MPKVAALPDKIVNEKKGQPKLVKLLPATEAEKKQIDAPELIGAKPEPVELTGSRDTLKSTLEPGTLLPSEAKPAYDLIMTILRAVERTHGYLSKTLLSQHLSGVESKAVQGLRLQRLPEFGILKAWKKSHASGFLDKTLDVGLMSLTELRVGKVTVSLSELGHSCLAGTQQIPALLMQYVHQCQQASEGVVGQVAGRPLIAPAKSIERLDSTESKPVAKPVEGSKNVSVPKPFVVPINDDPVRPIAALPIADFKDAGLGRDVTAPMIEDWRWTVRLVEHGYRLGECALIRGKIPDSILEDLTKALQDGKRFSLEHLFDRRTQIAVKELKSSGVDPANPPSIFQSYPSLWRFIQRWIAIDKGVAQP